MRDHRLRAPCCFGGYLGMPRRYHTYPPEFQAYNVMSSAGAVVLAVAYLLPLMYLTWSLFQGERAPNNPWGATGLEWTTTSPPPPKNFDVQPLVDRGPYQYHAEGESAGTDAPEVQNAGALR
jgi:cytochrome c oxidase subunit 1